MNTGRFCAFPEERTKFPSVQPRSAIRVEAWARVCEATVGFARVHALVSNYVTEKDCCHGKFFTSSYQGCVSQGAANFNCLIENSVLERDPENLFLLLREDSAKEKQGMGFGNSEDLHCERERINRGETQSDAEEQTNGASNTRTGPTQAEGNCNDESGSECDGVESELSSDNSPCISGLGSEDKKRSE